MKNINSLEKFIVTVENLATSKALKKINTALINDRNANLIALNETIKEYNPLENFIDFFIKETKKENYEPIDIECELTEITFLLNNLKEYIEVIQEKINGLSNNSMKNKEVQEFISDLSSMKDTLIESIGLLKNETDSFKPFFTENMTEDSFQHSLDNFLESHNDLNIKNAYFR